MKTKFPMSMAAAILIASSGAAQATTFGMWAFGTPTSYTLNSMLGDPTGVTASSFGYTGTSAAYAGYAVGMEGDYVLKTTSWNVTNKDLYYAYNQPQYTSVSITPTAGYRYTLNSISFSIKQDDYVDYWLMSNQSGYGPSSSYTLDSRAGNSTGVVWTGHTVTLNGGAGTYLNPNASFANLTDLTEFRWYGVANAADTSGALYFDGVSIDGSTQARASLSTGKTNAASRVMQNTASVRSTLTLNNNALTAGTTTTEALNWTAALSGATGVSLSRTSGTGASDSTSTIYANVDTTTTGLKGGTATLTGSNAWRTNGTAGSTSVDYLLADTAVVAQRTVTAATVALGRQMSGYNLSTLGSKTLILSSSGDSNNYTSISVAGNLFDSTETFNKTNVSASGTIAASGTWASYAVTGEGLTGEGTYSSIAAGYTATLLSQRAVTADTVALGRQMSGYNLSTLGSKTVTLRSTGVDGSYTRVTAATNLFNSAETYATAATGSGTIAASGTFATYAVTGEGLTNEGTYSSIAAGYSATLLSQRAVTADTVALGRQMSGYNLSTLGSKTVTLRSTDADTDHTRLTVATNLFDSAETYAAATTGSGTIAASGTFATYAVTGEGLTNEGTYSSIAAGYSATLLSQRSVTADSISLGRQISGVSLALLTGKTTAFHSNQANSAYTSVSVNGQAFTDTTDRTLGVTGSGTLGASGTFSSYAVTPEGLTNEGSYGNVTVGYTATPLAQRTVTGATLALGRQMSGINLSTLSSKTLTLSSTGVDGSYTRTTVATNLFDSTESFSPTTTASGIIAATGTWASYAVTGEGLTGEGSYGNVTVPYTATLVSKRAVTADSISLGRQISGVSLALLTGKTTAFHSNQANSAYTSVSVNGQAFNDTTDRTLGVTGSGTLGASGTFASCAVTPEGLTGEGTYSNVTVGYTATPLAKRSVTADTVALGRQMSGYNLSTLGSKNVTLRSTGLDTGNTRLTAATNLFDSTETYTAAATGSGTIAASGTWASYPVTAEGLTGEGSYANVNAGYSATLLSKRSVTADSISLGRQISGVSLALLTGKTTAFHSNQANSAYTSVSVNGQAFTDTTDRTLGVTGSGTLGASGTFSSYAVTPEGLTNEGTYGNVTVGYTATPLVKRAVTGATLALGRQMSGINLSELGSQTLTLSSTGVDGSYTRTTVAGNLFNSTETVNKPDVTASGVIAATGTWASYPVTAEGLTGEGSYSNVNVGYIATLLSQRSVTVDSISLGRQISGVSLALLTGKTTAFHSNQANSAYTSVSVNGQAFNDTADHTLGVTGSGALGASGIFASYAVTGEGLTGEGSYGNVAVDYSATPVSQRTVTGDTLVLGGKYLSGARLDNLGTQALTLRSDGADASNTRVTVAGNVFDTTGSFDTSHTGSGIIANSGTFASYEITGEGLTGEASYGNVAVGYTAAVVGNAGADKSGVKTAFGEALNAPLMAADHLVGLSSWTAAESVVVGTSASLLDGIFGDTPGSVSMAWRARTPAEATAANRLAADVVDLHTGTGTLNPFVLQMSYDPSLLPLTGDMTEEMLAAQGGLFLAWLNGADQWVNAVNGNLGTNSGIADYLGSWLQAGSPMALGSWGVDTSSNSVWAVVDHNSQFSAMSAVPEPANLLALSGLVSSALLLRSRRKRVA